MNLTKIIYPELILDRRGNALHRRFLKMFVEAVTFTPAGMTITLPSLYDYAINDHTFTQHVCLARKFKDAKAPTYHVCTDFGNALLNLNDRELPLKILPDFLGYISFPDNLVFDNEDMVEGALVYIGIADEKTAVHPELYGKRILWLTYPCVPKDGDADQPPIGSILVELKSDTVENIMAGLGGKEVRWLPGGGLETINKSMELHEGQKAVAKLCLNTILYLSSQDPELARLTPTFGKSHSVRAKHKVNGHLNSCTVPVVAVNWSYQAEKIYHVDSTYVQTHPRWQRCGPEFSQIKLIWVAGHERHFKKENDDV